MKNIKFINELFDDSEQKYYNPSETPENIVRNFKTQEYSPVWKYFKNIFWEVPILQKCAYESDDDHFLVNTNDVLTFIVRNSDWHLSCGFYFPEYDKSDFCILYQKSDYRGDIIMPLDILNIEDEYCYIKDYDMKTSKEAVDILKNTFVPLMKKLGLSYDTNRDIKSTRVN